MKNSRLATALDEFAALPVTARLLTATVLVSTMLGLGAIVQGTRMVVVAAAVVLPWAPILFLKVKTDWKIYGWLAFFEGVVIFQIAHLAEHISQMVELHYLAWAPVQARGIVGDLDVEPVHFWWNLAILFGGTLLLLTYKRNPWLWASWAFSVWHQIEHTYIYFWWFLPKGISNHPGILGAGGIVDEANIYIPYLTTMGRADLHFWYNLFEIGLFITAFLWQAARLIRVPSLDQARKRFRWRHAFVGIAASQVALVTLAGLVRYSPASLSVPQNYATIQAAVDAAPEWAVIHIASGIYTAPVLVTKPLTLTGAGSALTILRVDDDNAPALVIQGTHNVIVKNLRIEGGLYGILVDESRDVQITNSAITGAWFAGIRVSRGAASIENSEIANTRGPVGMGIELANTISRGDSMIRNNRVHSNSHAGIDLHNSNAMIERNLIQDNGLRGIAVNEMSMAMVNSNQVSGNVDSGIYVQDHSMAELENNRVTDTHPGPDGTADGIRAVYFAAIMLRANIVQAPPGHDVVLQSEAEIEPFH